MRTSPVRRPNRREWIQLAARHLGTTAFDLRRIPTDGSLMTYQNTLLNALRDCERPQPDCGSNALIDWSSWPTDWLTPADDDWPAPHCPHGVLRIKGRIPSTFRVAIVGSRRTDAYGRMMARRIAESVIRSGGCVVSGGAIGIDMAAHLGALNAGGRTVSVLGSGLGHPSPRAHTPAFTRCISNGAVVSPFHDRQTGGKWTFLYRNPWIVALSHCVIIVQASQRSGALSTGLFALNTQTPVFCLTERGEHPLHQGCFELLRYGAKPLVDESSWRAGVLGLDPTASVYPSRVEQHPPYGGDVWALFSREPKTLDMVRIDAPCSSAELRAMITRLELDGWLEGNPSSGYVASQPRSENVDESN